MRSYLETILIIGVGGFIGANLRYFSTLSVARLLPNLGTVGGTFTVNLIGSLFLAVFLAWSAGSRAVSTDIRLLIATGFLGSFTTFSSFANEGVALARDGSWMGSAIYIVGTNVMCIIGAVLGLWIGNRL